MTQNDLDTNGGGDGQINNTVTADSAQTTPVSASLAVDVEQSTHVTLTKSGTVAGGTIDQAGDVVTYSILVTNDGVVSLNNPQVSDPSLGTFSPLLDPGAPIVDENVPLFIPIVDGDYNLGDTDNDGIEEMTDHNGARDPGETWQYVYLGDITQNGFHDAGETWIAFNLGDTNNNGVRDGGETFIGDANNNGIQETGERWQFKNVWDTNNNGLQDNGEIWQYANRGDNNHNGVEDPGETFAYANVGDTNQNGSPGSRRDIPVLQCRRHQPRRRGRSRRDLPVHVHQQCRSGPRRRLQRRRYQPRRRPERRRVVAVQRQLYGNAERHRPSRSAACRRWCPA